MQQVRRVVSLQYCSSVRFVAPDNTFYPFSLTGPYKPKVNILSKPNAIEAQNRSPVTMTIGDNVTALTDTSIIIRCPTSGVPTPTVTWTKDGEQVHGDGRYTVQDDGSLLISEAVEEDSARYTCIADSVIGKDNASTKVQIVGKWSE